MCPVHSSNIYVNKRYYNRNENIHHVIQVNNTQRYDTTYQDIFYSAEKNRFFFHKKIFKRTHFLYTNTREMKYKRANGFNKVIYFSLSLSVSLSRQIIIESTSCMLIEIASFKKNMA